MLNLMPLPQTESAPEPAPEPVIRLASLHNALRLVDGFGGGPASDFDMAAVAEEWEQSSDAERRCFDRRSATMLAVASAGLEVVTRNRQLGGEVSPAAMQLLADEIRAGLDDIDKLIRG